MIKGDHLTKSLIPKLSRSFNENVEFIKIDKNNKFRMFLVTKIIFSSNRKLMVFIKLRVQVVTKNTLEELAEIL